MKKYEKNISSIKKIHKNMEIKNQTKGEWVRKHCENQFAQ